MNWIYITQATLLPRTFTPERSLLEVTQNKIGFNLKNHGEDDGFELSEELPTLVFNFKWPLP